MNLLELKTGVGWIRLELAVCLSGLLLDVFGQIGEGLAESLRSNRFHRVSGSRGCVRLARCSASSSSASVPSFSCGLSNVVAQPFSEASWSRTALASAFCSSGGSLEASSNAFFRSCVMDAYRG